MTLKTVLRNFLNSVEATEARRQNGEDLFEIEFQKLKELTEQLKHNPDYVVNEGELEVNRRKNRYKDILPYDKSRVIISEYPGVPGSDYVNANYVKGASGSFAYIASQGPLPNTVADFWRMIWEAEVQVIVMACNERESGKYKCECYWPNEEGEKERQYGNITVELVKWRQVCPDFLVRTLKYRCLGEEERSLCQFHYTTWPDHGVPTTVQPILDMVRLMRDCQASEAVPILIHCSAGCGRTGTICAIDYVWSMMRLGKLTEDFNLYDIIADMRRQRIAMVQTKEQYILVHRAVGALFEQQLRVIDNHTYENLDGDGHPLMLRELQEQQPAEHIYEDVRSLMMNERPRVEDKENPYATIEETLSLSPNDSRESSLEPPNPKGIVKRRNSQILQKLCREESVKRLISGWNKAVSDKPEAAVKAETQAVVQTVDSSQLTDKEAILEQSKLIDANNYQGKNQDGGGGGVKLSVSATSDKSPPSEKLVGKATVIRRPSIAKLKALFEKSHVVTSQESNNNTMMNDTIISTDNQAAEDDKMNKRSRPLGRSHSHHVPRGRVSPSQETADSEVRRNVERERSVRRIVSPLAREAASKTKTKTMVTDTKNQIQVGSAASNSNEDQQPANNTPSANMNNNPPPPSDGTQNRNTKFGCVDLRNEKKASWYGEHDQKTMGSTKWYGEFESKTKEKDNQQTIKKPAINEVVCYRAETDQNKQPPPQLPIKKKSLFRYSDGKLSLNQTQIDVMKNIEVISVSNQKSNDTKAKDEVQDGGSTSSLCTNTDSQMSISDSGKSVCNLQTSNSESNIVSNSNSVKEDLPPKLPEKKVLGRNLSLRQKEKTLSATQADVVVVVKETKQTADDIAKGKCYLSHQVTSEAKVAGVQQQPQKEATVAVVTQSLSHKNHPGRKGDTIADRYTNVNPVTQKNIAQIEKTIKHHPRGAIIDLTSRTSFVENPNQIRGSNPNEKGSRGGASQSYSKYATVKCKMPVCNESENSTNVSAQNPSDFSGLSDDRVAFSKNPFASVENNFQNAANNGADNVESSYGILHSPPPRTRRPHLTKSIVKSKSGSDLSPSATATVDLDKVATNMGNDKEISQDKEINKAVKELNTIGYLLDALATQSLQNPSEAVSPQETEPSKTDSNNGEKPSLPVKQRINSQMVLRPPSERQSVSFPITQATNATNEAKIAVSEPVVKNSIHYVPDYEYIFPLQKSASAPHAGRMFPASQVDGGHHQPIPPHILKDQPLCRYQPDLCDIITAPPKPPRTFTHVPQNTIPGQLDGGRLLVSVASPKTTSKPDDIPSKHFNYDCPPPPVSNTIANQSKPNINPHASVTYPDFSRNYGGKESSNARVHNTYLSQPSSPFHNSVPMNVYQSAGHRPPHPSSYRTYPSYPEIHSVRAVPNHIPNTANPNQMASASHRIRQSSSLGYGLHHHHTSKGIAPPSMTFRRTQPDGLLTPVVSNPMTSSGHQVIGVRPTPSTNWYYDERTNTSATPDYGEIPVAPVYTMVRHDQDRHRVQWDSSVDEQQQVKGAKSVSNYENIYDVPKDCWSSNGHAAFMAPHGHELRHSQSDAGVYAALRTHASSSQKPKLEESLQANNAPLPDLMTQSASAALNCPLYSQVMKPKKSKSDANEKTNVTTPRKTRRSRDDMDLQPVAPPRSKRQLQLRRSVAGGLCESGYGMDGESTWHSDSEDESPPAVPEKTKGAYITIDPEDANAKSGPHSRRESAGAHNGGLGGTLSRALGKLSLLTKLTTSKSDANSQQHQEQQPQPQQQPQPPPPQQQHQPPVPTSKMNDVFQKETIVASSPASGMPEPRLMLSSSTHPASSNNANKPHCKPSMMIAPNLKSPNFGFPHRTHRRPKGPREPPEQWTQV